jgi:hypothetical protein
MDQRRRNSLDTDKTESIEMIEAYRQCSERPEDIQIVKPRFAGETSHFAKFTSMAVFD